MKVVPKYTKKNTHKKTQIIENIKKKYKKTHHEKHITLCIYSSQLIVYVT